MGDLALVVDVAVAGAAKCLNGKDVALFHLGGVGRLDNRHALGSVNAIR